MICFDANYLIGGVSEERRESARILDWQATGEVFCTAAPAWYEFLCGPISDSQVKAMRDILTEKIIPFEAAQAEIAARLFNAVNRPRRLRVDVMIAATAIAAGAKLATMNVEDFKLFVPHGLQLV